nr:protein-L-isoaspartate(D-aspartate) O-methyltransferase [Motiliproteus sp. SC1-56]
MLEEIASEVRETAHLIGRARLSDAVMEAMAQVPREAFVSPDLRREAYANYPLPIDHGQTISQPYMVALMTDLLEPRPQHRVLEVGTGCGYQSAVLSLLVERVVSLEVIKALATSARARLARLGYGNVEVIHADGGGGWPELAPYDGIIVTAAPTEIPPALIEQLADDGRLVIPVGGQYSTQQLLRVTKGGDGTVKVDTLLPVRFVPLTGDA